MKVREANENDVHEMHKLIVELAVYEKAGDQVELKPAHLLADGFGENPLFFALVAEENQEVIGLALYYYKYSTWKGKCLYLEDLVVSQAHRRKGVGAALFERVQARAKEEKVKRFEWQVLDWNEPAIEFYKKYAVHLEYDWLNCRIFNP
ncbi:MAG: GNAT family N-acetyltransferase [Flavobacteriales bacterium]